MAVETSDFFAGDPASRILGRPEEKPARIHRPQKAKPGPTGRTIVADIKLRMETLLPVVDEYKKLQEAKKVLKGIK